MALLAVVATVVLVSHLTFQELELFMLVVVALETTGAHED